METKANARRVNRSRLRNFIDKEIRFVGRVDKYEDGIAHLEAVDGGIVVCHLDKARKGAIVEVFAKVDEDMELHQTRGHVWEYPDGISMERINEAINLTFCPSLAKLFG